MATTECGPAARDSPGRDATRYAFPKIVTGVPLFVPSTVNCTVPVGVLFAPVTMSVNVTVCNVVALDGVTVSMLFEAMALGLVMTRLYVPVLGPNAESPE